MQRKAVCTARYSTCVRVRKSNHKEPKSHKVKHVWEETSHTGNGKFYPTIARLAWTFLSVYSCFCQRTLAVRLLPAASPPAPLPGRGKPATGPEDPTAAPAPARHGLFPNHVPTDQDTAPMPPLPVRAPHADRVWRAGTAITRRGAGKGLASYAAWGSGCARRFCMLI